MADTSSSSRLTVVRCVREEWVKKRRRRIRWGEKERRKFIFGNQQSVLCVCSLKKIRKRKPVPILCQRYFLIYDETVAGTAWIRRRRMLWKCVGFVKWKRKGMEGKKSGIRLVQSRTPVVLLPFFLCCLFSSRWLTLFHSLFTYCMIGREQRKSSPLGSYSFPYSLSENARPSCWDHVWRSGWGHFYGCCEIYFLTSSFSFQHGGFAGVLFASLYLHSHGQCVCFFTRNRRNDDRTN